MHIKLLVGPAECLTETLVIDEKIKDFLDAGTITLAVPGKGRRWHVTEARLSANARGMLFFPCDPNARELALPIIVENPEDAPFALRLRCVVHSDAGTQESDLTYIWPQGERFVFPVSQTQEPSQLYAAVQQPVALASTVDSSAWTGTRISPGTLLKNIQGLQCK